MTIENLKSNGFGRFYQQLIVRIDRCHAEHAQEVLDAEKHSETDDHVDLLWTRLSRKRGDDEDIVFDLDWKLDLSTYKWVILWEESVY